MSASSGGRATVLIRTATTLAQACGQQCEGEFAGALVDLSEGERA
jgi:hypothetical protein